MAVNKKLLIAFTIAFYVFIFISSGVLTALARNVFTIPYLTPFAHFVTAVILPFVTLIMPLSIGAAIKLYKQSPFPSRKQWLIQTGCVILQQSARVGRSGKSV
jgi:hypothetical protein